MFGLVTLMTLGRDLPETGCSVFIFSEWFDPGLNRVETTTVLWLLFPTLVQINTFFRMAEKVWRTSFSINS